MLIIRGEVGINLLTSFFLPTFVSVITANNNSYDRKKDTASAFEACYRRPDKSNHKSV